MARKKGDYVVATRLTLSGQKEFNEAMKQAAASTDTFNSKMKLAKARYENTGDEAAFLAEKLDLLGKELENEKSQLQQMNEQLEGLRTRSKQAEENVRQLEQQLNLTPQGTEEWKKLKDKLNDARLESQRLAKNLANLEKAAIETETAATELEIEIRKNTEAQEKLGRESEDTGRKIADNLGDAAEEAQSKFQQMAKSIQQDLGTIKNMKKLSIAIDLVRGAWDVGNQIYSYVADSTREGMEQAKTDYNIAASGGSVERGHELVTEYGAIFGDTDAAREAATNLAAMNLSAESYEKAAKAIGGAAIKFQDTLKVEGLADSLQESLSTGALTGPMAEFFERMESQTGLSLETVNAGLAEAKKAEEAGMEGAVEKAMMAYIDATGIGDYYEGFKEQNENLFQAAEATKSIEQTVAEIGTELATTVAPLLGTVAKDLLPPIKATVNAIASLIAPKAISKEAESYFDKENEWWNGNKTLPSIRWEQFNTSFKNWLNSERESFEGSDTTDNRHTYWSTEELQHYATWLKNENLGETDESKFIEQQLEWREKNFDSGSKTLEKGTEQKEEIIDEKEANEKSSLPGMQWLRSRGAPEKTKIAWQVTAQTGGRTHENEQTPATDTSTGYWANLKAAAQTATTDLDAISQQMDDLGGKGTETGQAIMHGMSEGMRQKLQELQTVQENARKLMDAIWNPAIESTVVIGYRMGSGAGPVNQNLSIELKPQQVDLDGQTLTKILRDPINIMLNKLINQ